MALRNPIIKIQSKGVDSKCLMDMLFCQETLKELSPFKTTQIHSANLFFLSFENSFQLLCYYSITHM